MFIRRTKALASRVHAIAAQKPPASWLGEARDRPERKLVLKRAAAILPNGETLSVVIRDMSAGGTKIHYMGSRPLPSRILLSEPTTPVHAWADIVWRSRTAAGLRLV